MLYNVKTNFIYKILTKFALEFRKYLDEIVSEIHIIGFYSIIGNRHKSATD